MVQRGHGASFALEAFGELQLGGLDGDDAIQPRIAGLVHLSHASGADLRNDLVGAKFVTYRKRHRSDFTQFTRSRTGLCLDYGASVKLSGACLASSRRVQTGEPIKITNPRPQNTPHRPRLRSNVCDQLKAKLNLPSL